MADFLPRLADTSGALVENLESVYPWYVDRASTTLKGRKAGPYSSPRGSLLQLNSSWRAVGC